MSNNLTGLPTAGLRSALSRTIPLLPIIAMCSKRAAVQAPGARSSKRKRLSCSYGELQQALSFLVSFRRKLDTVPDSTGAETTGDDTAIDMDEEEFDKLDTLVASLTAKSSGLETVRSYYTCPCPSQGLVCLGHSVYSLASRNRLWMT